MMLWTRNRGIVMNKASDFVLSVRNLSVAFGGDRAAQVTDLVSFDIAAGEVFALVGESGCGKSVTAMSILRLLPVPGAEIVSGKVFFDGVDLLKLPLEKLRTYRGSAISCIFQEPMQALNPVIPVGKQLLEVLRHESKSAAFEKIVHYLKLAGFADVDRVMAAYPHELSGGMLQRVCIVMALLPRPRLLIADEPTTALDVTVQAQVLSVLKDLAREAHTSVLLITHNMGLVAQYAQRVAVMYAGRIVEMGEVGAVIDTPLHPYTRGLLAAIPERHADMSSLKFIPGNVPSPGDFVPGCRFAPRCSIAQSECANFPPKQGDDCHWAMCFFTTESF